MTDSKPTAPNPRYCNAKKRQGEGTCTRPAGWGTGHLGMGPCKLHGGRTQNVEARYARQAELLRMEADRSQVELWGGRTDVHPSTALLELVQWKAAEVAYWRGRVSSLDEARLTWGVTKREKGTEKGEHTDIKTFESRRHILLQLLRDAEQDLASYAAASLRAGVDQQLVMVAKSHAVRMLDVIRTVVADPRLGVRVPDSTADQVIADAVRGAIAS